MASPLPTLSMKRHTPHDIHHQLPSIITPGKPGNVNASKANNLQARGRMQQNHNHQRIGNNIVLPPLENDISKKSINQENINISNSFSNNLKKEYVVNIFADKPQTITQKEDGYLDSRYSDNGDQISEDSEKVDDDDEGGEVFDADPAEFGVTITKL